MTEFEKAARMALEALESAKNGLIWYREQHPEDNSAADDEMIEDIDAASSALTQALATTEPEVPTIDLDLLDWEMIKEAAAASKWIPPEYYQNDWGQARRLPQGEHMKVTAYFFF